MTSLIEFRSYFKCIANELKGEIDWDSIKSVEDIIKDAEKVHLRIGFLLDLANPSDDARKIRVLPFPDPLDDEERKACVKFGIVEACMKDLVSAGKIYHLAHSIKGLKAFTDALFVASDKDQADIWKSAFDLPFTISPVDTDDLLLHHQPIEYSISDIAEIIVEMFDLMENLYNENHHHHDATHVRNTSERIDIPVANYEWLLDLSHRLVEFSKTIPEEDEISETWEKIPYDEIRLIVNKKKEGKILDIVLEISDVMIDKLGPYDVHLLHESISYYREHYPSNKLEILFLESIVKGAFLNPNKR